VSARARHTARRPRRAAARPPRSREGRPPAVVVEIRNRQRKLAVALPWLEAIAVRALEAQGVAAAEIGVLIVDDARIAQAHGEWLGDPTPTDVITFDLSGDDPPGATRGEVRGDILVSAETAARIARHVRAGGATGWTPRHELAYYVVHGILHLTGHDDRTAADRRAMRARERVVMRAIGLPVPPRS